MRKLIRAMNREQFIQSANEVFKNRFDYSKTTYKNNRTKVCIICSEHGEFWQNSKSHLNGYIGCALCSKTKKYTTKEFVIKANEVHNHKYDYSKVSYINAKSKVCIICPAHGEFWQKPGGHLFGYGCPLCGEHKVSKEEFIAKANKKYSNKYDYSLVDFCNVLDKVKIICPEHGVFTRDIHSHLLGGACPACSGKLSFEQFVTEARKIHGKKFSYNAEDFCNMTTKTRIICPTHGEFWQMPFSHIKDKRCCLLYKESAGERAIRVWLEKHEISYERNKKFNVLGRLSYDFYIPSENLLIEYNGKQHYIQSSFGHHNLRKQRHHDWPKRKYARDNGFKLLTIPYWEFKVIDKILEENIGS